jgi:hypothetical protein
MVEAVEHLTKARDLLRAPQRWDEADLAHKCMVIAKRDLRWRRAFGDSSALALGLPSLREQLGDDCYERMLVVLAPRKRK